MKVIVSRLNGEDMTFEVRSSEKLKKLKEHILETQGTPLIEQRILFQGNYTDDEISFESHCIRDKDKVYFLTSQQEMVLNSLQGF